MARMIRSEYIAQLEKIVAYNVAEAFRDENGFLKKEYCSDYNSMGMHFTYEGAKVWVNYLLTHIPARLL